MSCLAEFHQTQRVRKDFGCGLSQAPRKHLRCVDIYSIKGKPIIYSRFQTECGYCEVGFESLFKDRKEQNV